MKREVVEEKFIDLIEGRLSPEQAREIETLIESDTALKESWNAYLAVIDAEQGVAEEKFDLSPNFSVNVMNQLEADGGFLARLRAKIMPDSRTLIGAISTVAVLVVVVQLASNQSGEMTQLTFQDAKRDSGDKNLPGSLVVPQELGAKDLAQTKGEIGAGSGSQFLDERSAKVPEAVLGREIRLDDHKKAPLKSKELAEQATSARMNGIGGSTDSLAFSGIAGGDASGRPEPKVSGTEPGYGLEISAINEPLGNFSSYHMPDWPIRPPTDNEEYINYTENPRIMTSDESISTFGVDVDTASYANVRRFIEGGTLPPRDAVRIEELLNYFDYDYPSQSEKPFTVNYEIAPSPLEPDRYLLKLGVKAREIADDRAPWNLVFLVDVSGSMSGQDRLELVKKGLLLLAQRMRPSDKLSVVTYANGAQVLIDGRERRRREPNEIINALNRMEANGGTNGGAGIQLAYTIAQQLFIHGGVNQIVLATDGDFNVGTTSRSELLQMIEEKRRGGVSLTTIGVGEGNLKDGTLEQLADRGNGNYHYLDGVAEMRKVFDTEITKHIAVIAKDVKLQVEFNPRHVESYRLIGYENRGLSKQEFHRDDVDSGEIGSGHTVTALYELVLANSPLAQESEYRYQKPEAKNQGNGRVPRFENDSELAFLQIRYKEPGSERSDLLRFPIAKRDLTMDRFKSSADFKFAAAVVYFGQVLRGSRYVGNYTLNDIAILAQNAITSDPEGEKRAFVNLVRSAASASKPIDQPPYILR